MSDPASPQDASEARDAVHLVITNLEARITKLEEDGRKTFLKRVTASASASALFLGLILTLVSLQDAFISKPETDRITRISQFNQAVNSAAKTRQELMQSQMQGVDPRLQFAMASAATPRILNDISTARAMLRDIRDTDVGIPQLIVLTSEAFTTGDMEAAKDFVSRAVRKTDVTPYLRSEAKRYEGRYLFLSGKPVEGRYAFQEALSALGEAPIALAARAYVLEDLVVAEFAFGDCANAMAELKDFLAVVQMPALTSQMRLQLIGTAKEQLGQLQGQRCTTLQGLDMLLAQ